MRRRVVAGFRRRDELHFAQRDHRPVLLLAGLGLRLVALLPVDAAEQAVGAQEGRLKLEARVQCQEGA